MWQFVRPVRGREGRRRRSNGSGRPRWFQGRRCSGGTPTQPKVVFLGDWLTAGWNLSSHPNRINKGIAGYGFPGRDSSDLVARFQSDVVSLHPAVVHIVAGSVDTATAYGGPTRVGQSTVLLPSQRSISLRLTPEGAGAVASRGPCAVSIEVKLAVLLVHWLFVIAHA